MFQLWFQINEIPSEGKQFEISEESAFVDLLSEYGLDYKVSVPLKASFFVIPQEEGCFVRGGIKGKITLPCNRCTEDANVEVDHSFESFEPFPIISEESFLSLKHRDNQNNKTAPKDEDFDADVDEEVIRYNKKLKGLEINLLALAWEELVLSLPIQPLCSKNCKGLCPKCGQNFNNASCDCHLDEGDPRLAALRNLNINQKKLP